ncbi:MAG: TetR family transcriptional regulator [Methylobacterium sp.]|uniref:TetR/AcrR family transcriptional regulator n=1 Tax=Methylobacterium sp. TaxID=409 RepID=UPI00258CCA9D|nr:TetR/AcrR family transcriptional regulator [Methylobacterium sp.]MBY0299740.1 TetR family transcriptional regulator [Methylobacterium sp.]
MARKPRTEDPGTEDRQSPGARPPREAIVEALMRLAAEQPWHDIEITDIAREAGVSLSEFRDHFPSKGAVLGGFSRMMDKAVLAGTTDDLADEPPRERLFDVLMRRLDAMTPYKTALRRIAFALRTDPLSLAALNGVALNSQRFMLAAAGISTEGPLGRLKLQGVVIAFARTLETWFEDDDPSLARTMARLDREIRNGERLMERAEDLRRLTAPFRALGRSLVERGSRRARRPRDEADDDRLDRGDPVAL